jgi:hypothetical protein
MKTKLSFRYLTAIFLVALLFLLLLPLQSALAGGCCFTDITIKSLDSGRQVTISGPALTAPHDLSTFQSFTDFSRTISKPSRVGPAYEVVRDGWDHLRYYPGVGDAPGAVYYEGLINGSSEYDGRWFFVLPEQDATLRQELASQGFAPSAQPAFVPLAGSGLALAVLLLVVAVLRARTRASAALAALIRPRTESNP